MAKLTSKARAAIPTSKFAGPNRSFPITDKSHAKAALMDINSAPASARPKIRAKAKGLLSGIK